MHQVELDGVPVLWEQGPAPLRATLTFGVGGRDESFRTLGVTHLVEHLVMGALPRVHYETNASVDLSMTSFTACGRPEQVAQFVTAVCRVLADLPVDRLTSEAGVLAAEGGFYAHPTVEALMYGRFGARGLGLAPYSGPGYDRITAEHVRACAGRFFVSGNAVLQLTGPVPDGLRLPLPAGPAPRRERQAAPAVSGPTWAPAATPGVGAALLGRRETVWSVGMSVLAERLEAVARHERGLSYEIDGDAVPLAGEDMLLAITVDAREGQEATVAGLLWQQLEALATDGPTTADIDHEIGRARDMYEDPRYVEVDLAQAAEAVLLGVPYRPRQQRYEALTQVTAQAVRDRFAAALPSVQLVVPDGVRLAIPGVGEGGCPRTAVQPPGRVFKPPLIAKLLARDARGRALILMPDGVAQRDPDGDVHVVHWTDVIGVERHDTERVVFGAGGCQVVVDPELYPGAEKMVAAVDANVPAALCYPRSSLLAPDSPDHRAER